MRRSPSVAKGETPLPSMSSSKDPPVPNNGHLQIISVATATNISDIESKHPCLPRQVAREGSEKIGRTTSLSNVHLARNDSLSVQEAYGITSFSNSQVVGSAFDLVQEVYGITSFSNYLSFNLFIITVQEVYGITSFSNRRDNSRYVMRVQEVYGITSFSNRTFRPQAQR